MKRNSTVCWAGESPSGRRKFLQWATTEVPARRFRAFSPLPSTHPARLTIPPTLSKRAKNENNKRAADVPRATHFHVRISAHEGAALNRNFDDSPPGKKRRLSHYTCAGGVFCCLRSSEPKRFRHSSTRRHANAEKFRSISPPRAADDWNLYLNSPRG